MRNIGEKLKEVECMLAERRNLNARAERQTAAAVEEKKKEIPKVRFQLRSGVNQPIQTPVEFPTNTQTTTSREWCACTSLSIDLSLSHSLSLVAAIETGKGKACHCISIELCHLCSPKKLELSRNKNQKHSPPPCEPPATFLFALAYKAQERTQNHELA
jgi:hypothetical protein